MSLRTLSSSEMHACDVVMTGKESQEGDLAENAFGELDLNTEGARERGRRPVSQSAIATET